MKNIVYVFLVLSCLFAACAAKKSESSMADTDTLDETTVVDQNNVLAKAQLAPVPTNDLYSNGKVKLIKNVHYRFEVENVKTATENIEAAIKKYPAYISSSNLHLDNPILENKITIRVQSEYFHDLLKEIDLQARFVNFRDVKTDDVSKEFVDLESRLKTKREVEERYTDILRKKAGTIEELLNAEREIGELHEEIEATVSRINYLKEQVSYSTLELEFYQTISQEIASADTVTPRDRFIDALSTGWEGLVTIIVALAYLWPIYILAGIIIIYLKIVRKKIRIQYK
ncbi:MAG TPA: DUF4349 domain-containing protein [Ohtaekwangia sp.]|uniref:DUF4349 domain-containing protein n=1 Tax=Ohtaekwangia sp. TaxID=2066019 RepID=UPI002F93F5A0